LITNNFPARFFGQLYLCVLFQQEKYLKCVLVINPGMNDKTRVCSASRVDVDAERRGEILLLIGS